MNWGGSYYYRYGFFHSNVLALEVALPQNGQILDLGYAHCHLIDNTGYAIKNLCIGSERMLGVVTKA